MNRGTRTALVALGVVADGVVALQLWRSLEQVGGMVAPQKAHTRGPVA